VPAGSAITENHPIFGKISRPPEGVITIPDTRSKTEQAQAKSAWFTLAKRLRIQAAIGRPNMWENHSPRLAHKSLGMCEQCRMVEAGQTDSDPLRKIGSLIRSLSFGVDERNLFEFSKGKVAGETSILVHQFVYGSVQ
jgi:hypothetical protein